MNANISGKRTVFSSTLYFTVFFNGPFPCTFSKEILKLMASIWKTMVGVGVTLTPFSINEEKCHLFVKTYGRSDANINVKAISPIIFFFFLVLFGGPFCGFPVRFCSQRSQAITGQEDSRGKPVKLLRRVAITGWKGSSFFLVWVKWGRETLFFSFSLKLKEVFVFLMVCFLWKNLKSLVSANKGDPDPGGRWEVFL